MGKCPTRTQNSPSIKCPFVFTQLLSQYKDMDPFASLPIWPVLCPFSVNSNPPTTAQVPFSQCPFQNIVHSTRQSEGVLKQMAKMHIENNGTFPKSLLEIIELWLSVEINTNLNIKCDESLCTWIICYFNNRKRTENSPYVQSFILLLMLERMAGREFNPSLLNT